MSRKSTSGLLSLFAVLSLLPAVVLLCGYFSIAGPTIVSVRMLPAARLQSTRIELDRGRVRIWLATQTPPPAGAIVGRHVRWNVRPALPDLRRCFWEFDNHSLTSVLTTKGATAYIIAFPIWCVLGPFLIAPTMWIWKRRQPRVQVGFPLDVAAGQSN